MHQILLYNYIFVDIIYPFTLKLEIQHNSHNWTIFIFPDDYYMVWENTLKYSFSYLFARNYHSELKVFFSD